MALVTPLALQRKPVGAQLLWRRTLALRIICDQALRGAFAARGRAVVNGRADAARPAVALAAYRERVRRFAAYLADRRLPRLSRVLLSHHWSAWAAVFGATPQRKAACLPCGRDRGAAAAVCASPAALGWLLAFACAFCASQPLDKALFSVREVLGSLSLTRAAPPLRAGAALATWLASGPSKALRQAQQVRLA